MWISRPTPVTTSRITALSRSTPSPALSWIAPTWNQFEVCAGLIPPATTPKELIAPISETKTVLQAISATLARPSREPKSPRTSAPSSGASGIRKRWLTRVGIADLAPQRAEVGDLEGAAGPEDRDEHGQSDRGLGGGDGDHQEGDGVSTGRGRAVERVARERQERRVCRVEHQLDRHEDEPR